MYKGCYDRKMEDDYQKIENRIVDEKKNGLLDILCLKFQCYGYDIRLEINWLNNFYRIIVSDKNYKEIYCLTQNEVDHFHTYKMDENTWLIFDHISGKIYSLFIEVNNNIKNYVKICSDSKKYVIKKGLIVAFIGVDGSGKTTIADEISLWISSVFQCDRKSMGIGRNSIQNNKRKIKKSFKQKKIVLLKRVKRNFSLLLFSFEVHNDIKSMKKGMRQGMIYILDRYPQTKYRGISDGPKITSGCILSWLEAFFLKIADTVTPTLLFKLCIPLSVAIERRPEDDTDILKRKIRIAEEIDYVGSKVIKIDATQPYAEELKSIKSYLWNEICSIGVTFSEN